MRPLASVHSVLWVLLWVLGAATASFSFRGWPEPTCNDTQLVEEVCAVRAAGKFCYPCSPEMYIDCGSSEAVVQRCKTGYVYDAQRRFCVPKDTTGVVTCPGYPCPMDFSSLPGVTLLAPQLVRSTTNGAVSLTVVDVTVERAAQMWVADALPARCMLGRSFQVTVTCPSPLPRAPTTWVVDLGDVAMAGTSIPRGVPAGLPPVTALCGDKLRVLSEGGRDNDYMLAMYEPQEVDDEETVWQAAPQTEWLCPPESVLASSPDVVNLSPPLHANTITLPLTSTAPSSSFWVLDTEPGHCAAGLITQVSVSCPPPAGHSPTTLAVPWQLTGDILPSISAYCGDSLSFTWGAGVDPSQPLTPRFGLATIANASLVRPVYVTSPVSNTFRGWPTPGCDDDSLAAGVCSVRGPGQYCYPCHAAKYVLCGGPDGPSVESCQEGYVYDAEARFCVVEGTPGYEPCPVLPYPSVIGPQVVGLLPPTYRSVTAAASNAVPVANLTLPSGGVGQYWLVDTDAGHAAYSPLLQVSATCPAQRSPPSLLHVHDLAADVVATCGDTLMVHAPAPQGLTLMRPDLYNAPFLPGLPQPKYLCPVGSGPSGSGLPPGSVNVLPPTRSAAKSWTVPPNMPEIFLLDPLPGHCAAGMVFKVSVSCPAPRGYKPRTIPIDWRLRGEIYPDVNAKCGDVFVFNVGSPELAPMTGTATEHGVVLVTALAVSPAYLASPAELTVRDWPDVKCDDAVLVEQVCSVRPPGYYCYPCDTSKYIRCGGEEGDEVAACNAGEQYDKVWQQCVMPAQLVAACTAFPCPTLASDSTQRWMQRLTTTTQYDLAGRASAVARLSLTTPGFFYVADALPGRCPLGAGALVNVTCPTSGSGLPPPRTTHLLNFSAIAQDESSLVAQRPAAIQARCNDGLEVRGWPGMTLVKYSPQLPALNTPLLPDLPQPVYSCPSAAASGLTVLLAPQRSGAYRLTITQDLGSSFWLMDPAPGSCRNGMIFKVTTSCPAPADAAPRVVALHWVMTGNVYPDMHLSCGDVLSLSWGDGEINTQLKTVRIPHGVAIASQQSGISAIRGGASTVTETLLRLPDKLAPVMSVIRGITQRGGARGGQGWRRRRQERRRTI